MAKNKPTQSVPLSPKDELAALRAQAQAIHDERYAANEDWNKQLRLINARITELEQFLMTKEAAGGA